ncbi:recombinase family protein [Lichenibacterium ramalinae]|uniref:recombinase family protein n=1 Tax=Lichenibacterium ramalinae TaxID=2316527 RepID=UPI003D17D150
MTGAFVNQVQAAAFAMVLREEIEQARQNGASTTQEIADDLNARGVPTRRSGIWHRASVNRLLRRQERYAPAPSPPPTEPEPPIAAEPPTERGPYVPRGIRRRMIGTT